MAVQAAKGVIGGRASASESANADIPSGSSSSSIGQREDLANFISMITRDETPFMSSIGKTKATAIYHEWQTDELAPPGNSRIGEGTDYVLPTGYTFTDVNNNIPTNNQNITGTSTNALNDGSPANATAGTAFAHTGPNRTRLGNYCQINGKTIAISGTRRVIDQAGVADEYAYQLKKRGTELRRDIEFDIVQTANTASAGTATAISGGTTNTTARRMATYRAWINDANTVEVAASSGGALPSSNQGTGQTAPALADYANRGSLSLSDIDLVMQKIYQEGGKANKIMLSPKLRRDFSDLMVSDTGVRRNLDDKGKLRQSVDVYMSDFGDVMVMPNYIMGFGGTGNTSYADEAAFIYDSQWFSIATLRPLQEIDVGQRGDSTIGMMVEEFTMEVKNPIGCGAIYGLR